MRIITFIIFILFSQCKSYSQPSAATVQKDVKNDLGANCVSVKVGGGGSTATEYVNGGYSTFYRVSVSAIFKTDISGVTKIAKGAAKYSQAGGGKYTYNQYAPGTVEYEGLSAPDTSTIRALVLSMSDYGLTQATFLDDVVSFSFLKSPEPLWHTLLSVSVPVNLVFTRRISNIRVETVKRPYLLRLYRNSANEPWTNVAWTTVDNRMYHIKEESLSTETIGEYKLSKMTYWAEKSRMKEAEKISAARPKVEIPTVNNMKDVFKWYHALLMEGDYAKVEAAIIQLLHPDLIDSRTKLLDANAVVMLDRMKKVLTNDFSTYKKQYCTTPVLFEVSDTEIYWWNKDKTQKSSITIKKENNKWYIYNVASYLWTFYNEAQANATMNTACK
jgi:hypothetical protein